MYGCFGCHGCSGAGAVIIGTPIHGSYGGIDIHVGSASAPFQGGLAVGTGVAPSIPGSSDIIVPTIEAAKKPLIPEINPLLPKNETKNPTVDTKKPLIPEIPNPFDKKESTSAKVTVEMSADARLWVDNVECPLTGAVRTFSTPALQPGQTYYYNVQMEVTENGQRKRDNQRVFVRAGESVNVTFGSNGALAQR